MRARVPAFDALEPGDLVDRARLGARRSWRPGRPSSRDARGRARRRAGLGRDPGRGRAGADAGGRSTGAPRALPGSRHPERSRPRADAAALERSVVGFIVGRGAELERQAALLEAELRRRALEGGGVAGLVATVSAFLGRALALEAGRGAPIVVHAPAEAPGAAAEAARYEAGASGRAGAGGAARRAARPAAGAAGSLLVLGAEPASELARVTLPRVAGARRPRACPRRGHPRRARTALAGPSRCPPRGPPWVVILARQREPGGEDDAPAAREAREAARRAIRLLAPARRMTLRGDADSLEIRAVAAGDLGGGASALAERGRASCSAGPSPSRARSRAPPTGPPPRPRRGRRSRPRSPSTARRGSPARTAWRSTGCWARCTSCPTATRLALAVLAPLLDGAPRRPPRADRDAPGASSATAASARPPPRSASTATRSPTGCAGSRPRPAGSLADPELRLPLALALEFVQEDQV